MINIKNISLSLFLMFALSVSVAAQQYTKSTTGITTTIGDIRYEIQLFSSKTVRILKAPSDSHCDKSSLSVIQKAQRVNYSVSSQQNNLILKTSDLQVAIDMNNGRVSFLSAKGTPLLKEKDGGKFTDFVDVGTKTYSVYQPFA